MSRHPTKIVINIVLSSPGDVTDERRVVSRVIDELNRGVAADRHLHMELLSWETESYPGIHIDGPQGIIDPTLKIQGADIFIVILWQRFGTPTKDALSGTAHEYQAAYDSWKRRKRPQIMIYFKETPDIPQSTDARQQYERVQAFRKTYPKEGLFWTFKTTNEFEDLIRAHLTNYLRYQYKPISPSQFRSLRGWIILFLSALLSVGTFFVIRHQYQIYKLKEMYGFKKNELGILVADFYPVTHSQEEIKQGKELASKIVDLLNSYMQDIGTQPRKLTPLSVATDFTSIRQYETNIKELGELAGADLVVVGKIGTKNNISSTIYPIHKKLDRYQMDAVFSQAQDAVRFEGSLDFITKDINRFISFILGYTRFLTNENVATDTSALSYFRNALGFQNPVNDAFPHLYMGNCYYFLGRELLAKNEFRRAIDLNRTLMEARNNLGVMLLDLDADSAYALFKDAYRCEKCNDLDASGYNPGCVHLMYNLAYLELEKSRFDSARNYADGAISALKLNPRLFSNEFVAQLYNDAAYAYIGDVFPEGKAFNISKAKNYLSKINPIVTRDTNGLSEEERKVLDLLKAAWHRNWGRIYLGQEKWEPALRHFNLSLKHDTTYAEVHLLLAQLYNNRCKPGDGDSVYTEKMRYMMKKSANSFSFDEALNKSKKLLTTCNR